MSGLIALFSGAMAAMTSTPPGLSNGASQLGTLNQPYLPFQLDGSAGFSQFGGGGSNGQNPYNNVPKTGVVRSYDWTISRGQLAPDGFLKEGMFINGGYPGPILEANWGDTFQITIHNNITNDEEGTSMHWHGMRQVGTPWYDGVPGTSQCPVAPGSNFTYTFQADQYGTSWYHAHFSSQYINGLFGAIVVYGPVHVPYDIDIGPVMVNDYYHTGYYTLLKEVIGKEETPYSDNNMINGRMPFNCSLAPAGSQCNSDAGYSKFKFQSGKRMRLRLINAGAEALQKFTIDGHKMTVIANDFTEVQPYEVDVVTLAVGQRTDVIVEGIGLPTESFWMRSTIVSNCSFTNQPYAMAEIYYEDADTNATPQSTATEYSFDNCSNNPLEQTVPLFQRTPPAEPAVTTNLVMDFQKNGSGFYLWTMNNSTYRADYNEPILLLAHAGNTTYAAERNNYNYDNQTSVRFIITTKGPLHHPMHVHGHNMWVLDEGYGDWDGTIVNPQNPQYRDTQQLVGGDPDTNTYSYIVVEWLLDNPGVWPLHCHNAWHLSGGMFINTMEQPDVIKNDMQIPDLLAQTCRDWWTWTGHDVVDQIDSGV